MQTGSYIAKRQMPAMIRAACQARSIIMKVYSDDWVIRLERIDDVHWIVGYKFDLNSSAASELAQDKVATYTILQAHGVPVIDHYLVRSTPHEPLPEKNLRHVIGNLPVVIKPLDGAGGRLVSYYETLEAALEAINISQEKAWAIAPHYELQAEYRIILLDDQLLLAIEKTRPTYRGKLKLFNLSHGAFGVDIMDQALLDQLLPLARQARQALGLRLAAVDIVKRSDDSLLILEINDSVSLEHYAAQSAVQYRRTQELYKTIINKMFA